tara:strand:- start:457 stop:711 length:255 start_codon:yes stop_codon:yes gene_type:complete
MEYPFNEGDTYYTLEVVPVEEIVRLEDNGEDPYLYRVVESCWDENTIEMHWEKFNSPIRPFKTREEAEAKNITNGELRKILSQD